MKGGVPIGPVNNYLFERSPAERIKVPKKVKSSHRQKGLNKTKKKKMKRPHNTLQKPSSPLNPLKNTASEQYEQYVGNIHDMIVGNSPHLHGEIFASAAVQPSKDPPVLISEWISKGDASEEELGQFVDNEIVAGQDQNNASNDDGSEDENDTQMDDDEADNESGDDEEKTSTGPITNVIHAGSSNILEHKPSGNVNYVDRYEGEPGDYYVVEKGSRKGYSPGVYHEETASVNHSGGAQDKADVENKHELEEESEDTEAEEDSNHEREGGGTSSSSSSTPLKLLDSIEIETANLKGYVPLKKSEEKIPDERSIHDYSHQKNSAMLKPSRSFSKGQNVVNSPFSYQGKRLPHTKSFSTFKEALKHRKDPTVVRVVSSHVDSDPSSGDPAAATSSLGALLGTKSSNYDYKETTIDGSTNESLKSALTEVPKGRVLEAPLQVIEKSRSRSNGSSAEARNSFSNKGIRGGSQYK